MFEDSAGDISLLDTAVGQYMRRISLIQGYPTWERECVLMTMAPVRRLGCGLRVSSSTLRPLAPRVMGSFRIVSESTGQDSLGARDDPIDRAAFEGGIDDAAVCEPNRGLQGKRGTCAAEEPDPAALVIDANGHVL